MIALFYTKLNKDLYEQIKSSCAKTINDTDEFEM